MIFSQAWIQKHRLIASCGAVIVALGVTVAAVVLLRSGQDSIDDRSAQPAAPMSPLPEGSFGITAGANVEIAPGVVAVSFSAPVNGRGRIELDGPAKITLRGEYTFVDDQNWSVELDGGSGSVAGVQLRPEDFSGTVAMASEVVSSDVTIGLLGQPRIVPEWTQSTNVHISYEASAQALVGDVELETSRLANSIAGGGRLDEDDTYTLALSGGLTFAGAPVSLVGTYTGVENDGRPGHGWSIDGGAESGALKQAQVTSIAVRMDESTPGVTGSVTVRPGGVAPIDIRTGLRFVDQGNWQLRAKGSDTEVLEPREVPRLAVRTGEMIGWISSVDDFEAWNLFSPFTVADERLEVTGWMLLGSPYNFILEAGSAEGRILGSDLPADVQWASGRVDVDSGVITGLFKVRTSGELLVDMPDSWETSAELSIAFEGTAKTGVSAVKSLEYTLNSGDSRLVLSGSFASSDAFELAVGGVAAVASTPVPFGGYFQSVGWVVDGLPLTSPRYSMLGDISSVPGGVDVGGGSNITAGTFGFTDGTAPVRELAFDGADLDKNALLTETVSSQALTAPTTSGTFYFTLSSNNPWTLKTTVDYEDQNNWTASVVTSAGDPWTVSAPWVAPGVSTLSIDPNNFSGSITDSDGEVDWEVRIAEVVWENTEIGSSLTTDFSVGNSCPLEENCPEASGIFLGFTNGAAVFPSPIPQMATDGAILADGSWARFSAMPDDVTFKNISMHDTEFTMWKGERTDSFSEDLEMPDLSSENSGFNLEFCGYFRISIPDITTVDSGGCVEWTNDGVVMAQIAPGGDVDTEASSGGVTIGNTTIDGWAWSDLSFNPEVLMNGVELALDQDLNEMTGTIAIPAKLMKATGNADSDATITATGWYSSGDFSLDSTIAVNMKSGGFALDSVSVHIGKDGSHFSLGLGANATVAMGGNHFPVEAFIGIEAGGGSNEITVRVSAKGAVNNDPTGGFDTPSSLPTGTFEPDYSSIIDGSFDGKQEKPVNDDPGFEKSTGPINLVSNADFETGVSTDVFGNSDFESGLTGNLLSNNDAEGSNVMVNGDFESGTTGSWSTNTGYSSSIISGTAPSDLPGNYYMQLSNSSGSSNAYDGIIQPMPQSSANVTSYQVSAWVKSNDSTNGRAILFLAQEGTNSGCPTQSGNLDTYQSYAVTPTWQKITLNVTANTCRASLRAYINVPDRGDTVQFDSIAVNMMGSNGAAIITNQGTPSMVDEMSSVAGRLYTGQVFTTSDFGNPGNSLRSDGYHKGWMYNNPIGYVNGDFDVSYDVFFPSSGTQDIADFGFWLKNSGGFPGSYSSMTGYAFALDSGNCDGGFWGFSNGGWTRITGSCSWGNPQRNKWWRVHLVASGSTLTATLIDPATGAQGQQEIRTLPGGNRDGYFGQVPDNHGASEGHRWDNLQINHTSNSAIVSAGGPRYVFDQANAHGGNGYMSVNGQAVNYTTRWSTGELPETNSTYTYSTWVRSRSGTMTGTLVLDTDGGTYEFATKTFTATSTWQKVSVSLKVANPGHTDLRPGIRDLSSTNQLDIDDQMLQKIPGWSYGGGQGTSGISSTRNSGQVDVAHAGVGSLVLTDNQNGSWFTLNGISPRSGASYATTMWVRAESGTVNGQYQLSTIDASGQQTQSTAQNFSVSTAWQQLTINMTVNGSGQTNIRLQIFFGGNTSIRVDDIQTKVTGADVPQEVDQAWGPQSTYTDFSNFAALPITKSSGVTSATDYGNSGSSLATTGYGNAWMFNAGSWGYTSSDFDMSTDIYFPNSPNWEIADIGFWMTGSLTSQTGYSFRLNTVQTSNYGFVKATNGALAWVDQSINWGTVNTDTWYRVKLRSAGSVVTVEVIDLGNGSTIGTQSVTMPAGNRAGAFGQMQDGAGTSPGSRWDNFQVFRGSSVTSNQKVILDASKSHGGSAALQITAPSNSTATATRNIGPAPTAGSSYTATAWVRSAAGSVNGSIALAGQSTGSTSFTATTTWQQVSVTTAMGSGTAQSLTTTFTNSSGNSTLIVDDVSVQLQGYAQQNPWIPAPDAGGSVSQTVWNDATKAHSGSNYLEVQPSVTAANFYKEVALTLTPNDVYTASFWVKSKDGSNQGGSFALAQGLWSPNTRWVDFTANGTWQQYFVTLPISSATPAVLDLDFYLQKGSKAVLIDDVELRKVNSWGVAQPTGTTVNEIVNQDGGAASGAGFLQISANGANTGIYASQAATSSNGTGYSIEAYVRSTTGANVSGTLKLYASGANGSSNVATQPFTANGDWQYVTIDLTSNGSYTSLTSEVRLTSGGKLDVDEIKVMPKIVVQDDPWQTSAGSGGSVSAVVYADSANAHDSLGVLRVSKTGSSDSSIQHAIPTAPAAGSKYVMTAWVRSVTAATLDGQWTLSALGGTQESVSQSFQANPNWQMVTLTLPVNNGGHTSMLAQMVMRTAGVEMWVDDVVVQQATWLTGAAIGTTMQSRQMNDASRAQSGSGYESISKSGSPDGWITRTASGAVNNGTSQTVEAYVRSASGANVTGRIRVTASGGSGTDVATSSTFTATGVWKKVTVTVPITQNGRNALQTQIFVDTQNAWLDIDSVVVGQAPLGSVDGVTTPLAHPNTGYTYLWDDAFGVPGAHLWALTAQIQFVNGRPGLGVGGTMYLDPTKMSAVMTGTDWIKGDMALNISRAEPCLAFGFDSRSLNSGIGVDGGVFTTKQFQISMAPKGCQVGEYVIPQGSSLSFDAQFGDGEVHIDLAITRDEDNLPEFHADMGVTNIKLGGFLFNSMELKIDVTTSSAETHFLGDFETPLGKFYADYNLTAVTSPSVGFNMDATVSVTNWALKSSDFSVSSFNYHQSMNVFEGQCSSFETTTSGNLTMKSKNYQFSGNLAMNCHGLQQLHFAYQYSKSGTFYAFYLDYDASTRVIAGGLEFDFDKRISWKYFGIRRVRHPQFAIKLDFSMPIDNPSAGRLTLYGRISVSGGNGKVSCAFGSPGDDGCSLHVHVNVFGGQTLDANW